MNIDFKKERENVRNSINSSKYNEAIIKCVFLLEFIEKNNIEDDYNKWFFNLRLAICYRKIGQVKKAINYTQKSMITVKEKNEYFESIWFMGNCFYSLGNKSKALKFYEKCKDYYQRNNKTDEYLYMSFNIAKITNNERLLREVIELYKINNISESSTNNAYECLCNLYIRNKQYDKAKKQMYNITNDNIIYELRNKMEDVNASNVL